MTCDITFMKVIFISVLIICVFIKNVSSEQVAVQKENYEPDYSVYHNLSSIMSDMAELVNRYSTYIVRNDGFRSKVGHPQLVIRISNFTKGETDLNKIRILLAYGEHAREFFPVESMFYLLRNLTSGLDGGNSSGAFSAWVVNNFDLYIIGITNPDGRAYLEQTKNYCWRGTGSGIDLNRNFDWNFGGEGSSRSKGDEEYRGSKAFSEPETNVFTKLAATIPFDAFLSFHSGIRHIYIPFADTVSKQRKRLPKNKDHLFQLARQMSQSSPSRPFKFGLAYRLMDYTADGTSFDYMAGAAEIPFSLAVEMWEHEHHTGLSCFDEFNPRSEHLQEELALVHPLYVEVFSYLLSWKKSRGAARKLKSVAGLIRVKKDEGIQNQPEDDNMLYVSQISKEVDYGTSFENTVMCIIFAVVALICVVFGTRHIYQMMHKKRIISLKSLSSTFSLYKSL